MEIRKAETKDIKEIYAMYDELEKFELNLLPKKLRDAQIPWEKPPKIEKVIKGRKTRIFVAEDKRNLMGFITCEFESPPGNPNYKEGKFDIFVKSKHRGKGIGTALIRTAEDWFGGKKCGAVFMNHYAANKNAIKFYKKLGYNVISLCSKKLL